eukprot:UN34338
MGFSGTQSWLMILTAVVSVIYYHRVDVFDYLKCFAVGTIFRKYRWSPELLVPLTMASGVTDYILLDTFMELDLVHFLNHEEYKHLDEITAWLVKQQSKESGSAAKETEGSTAKETETATKEKVPKSHLDDAIVRENIETFYWRWRVMIFG